MDRLHPIRRIGTLNRSNLVALRQIESACLATWLVGHRPSTLTAMTKSDPVLAQIATEFTHHHVEKSGGGYLILDQRNSNPVARLRPIPNTDRFELFYWSNIKGGWKTFGNMGRMKLMLTSAHEIVENDPMFRVPRAR